MSEQVGGLLQIAPSYNAQRELVQGYRSKTVDSTGFHKWAANNMYKSSYAHFHSKDSVLPKNTVIPGYGGYVPSIKAENIHARGFSAMAKQTFNHENLGKNKFGLASTGFNVNPSVFVDDSKLASSSKYGKTAIQRSHPNWNTQGWISTTQDFHRNPNQLVNPTYRQTDKWLQTSKPATKGSGFATNHAYLDGTGWKPHPILNGDNHRTEYRDRFNVKNPFHRNVDVTKAPQLKKTELNYKYN